MPTDWAGVYGALRDTPGPTFALGLITVVLIRIAHRGSLWLLTRLLALVLGLAFLTSVIVWVVARYPTSTIIATALPALVVLELAARSRWFAVHRGASGEAASPRRWFLLDIFATWRVLVGLLSWLTDVILGVRQRKNWLVNLYYQAAAAFGAIGLAVLLDHFLELNWRSIFVWLIEFWDQYIRAAVTWVLHTQGSGKVAWLASRP